MDYTRINLEGHGEVFERDVCGTVENQLILIANYLEDVSENTGIKTSRLLDKLKDDLMHIKAEKLYEKVKKLHKKVLK